MHTHVAVVLVSGVLLVSLGGVAGCKAQPCTSMPEMNALLTQAALVRVDVYDAAQAHCNGSLVESQAAPLLSRTFPGATAVRLDIPPGHRVVAMTTFGDADGKLPSGSACTEADLSGGRVACLSLTLTSIDGGACTPGNDSCPAGQFCSNAFGCESGCKTSTDCTDAAKPKCEPTRHQCVECLAQSDCSGGKVCSPSGVCSDGCDPATGCSGGRTCCNLVCVDPLTDPLNCNGCGNTCTGGNTVCCNGQCANPSTSIEHCGMCGHACSTLNATPTCSAGVCNWTCNASFVHCGAANSGCETASDNVNNCGGCGNVCMANNATSNSCNGTSCGYTCQSGFIDCLKIGADTDGCETSSNTITTCGGCTNVCDTAHATGATCPAGACVYTGCMPGYLDCNSAAPNTDGCECSTPMCCGTTCQPEHINGLGQSYLLMCVPLGTPGSPATYMQPLEMATAARAAAAAGTDGTMTCGNGANAASCLTRSFGATCATWCYTKSICGRVLMAASCTCPTASSPAWN